MNRQADNKKEYESPDPPSKRNPPSRLNLHFWKTLKRKFPKLPEGTHNYESLRVESATLECNVGEVRPALNTTTKPSKHIGTSSSAIRQGEQPAPIERSRESPIFTQYVDKEGRLWVNLPEKKKRRPMSPIKSVLDKDGYQLWELGHGWSDLPKCVLNKDCPALQRCKRALNGTQTSEDVVLNPQKSYPPPSFPDSDSDSEGKS